jgi:hypothetical protein
LETLWVFITDLGDIAVTLPLAVLIGCFLGAARQVRPAVGWGVAILTCAGVIGVVKLLLLGCGHRLPIPDLLSPSGHTAMSTAVYGSLCLLVADSRPPAVRAMVYTAGILLISGIAPHGSPCASMRRLKSARGSSSGWPQLPVFGSCSRRSRLLRWQYIG